MLYIYISKHFCSVWLDFPLFLICFLCLLIHIGYTLKLRRTAVYLERETSGLLSFRNLQCWLLLDALCAAVGSVSVPRKLFSGSGVWVSYMCSPLFIHSLYWCPLCHSPGQYYMAVTLQNVREGEWENVCIGNNWLNVKWSNFRHLELFIWPSLHWNDLFFWLLHHFLKKIILNVINFLKIALTPIIVPHQF